MSSTKTDVDARQRWLEWCSFALLAAGMALVSTEQAPPALERAVEKLAAVILPDGADALTVDLAAEQGVGVLGVSNYYDYDVYGDFVARARREGIFPLFGLEIIALIDELVRAGVEWARSLGMTELASDCDIENHVSEAFHLATGFEEVGRSICYRRSLTTDG